jgi:hypothetical protein
MNKIIVIKRAYIIKYAFGGKKRLFLYVVLKNYQVMVDF